MAEDVFERVECHECGQELEKVGNSGFGKCPECGREMLFSEWRQLQVKLRREG